MRHIDFSPEDMEALRRERFSHPDPRVQQKMEVLLLKSHGISHEKIELIVGICGNTVRAYLDEYTEGGIEKLKQVEFHRPASTLETVRHTLQEYFKKNPPATIKQAAHEIETLTGIKRGETQVRKFMKSIGCSRRKTGAIPAKADVDVQNSFLKDKLEPVLQKAREGAINLFFVDAAHFVHAPFLGYLWCMARVFLKAPSGRKRYNVLGALNAVTNQLISVTNESYINGASVCALMRSLADQCTLPIVLVLDNARYQKCQIVQALAKELKITLLYLPPYSPNLNLIERVWKFTKSRCLNSKYYENFDAFRNAISSFLSTMNTTYEKDLATLLTHRFQTFDMASVHQTA